MKPDMFEIPVTILTGLGMPTQIRSVLQAYRFLLEWPKTNHDAAHAVSLKACKAAIDGKVEPETARSIFVAFADKHDLLAPDLAVISVARRRHGSDPHLR